MRFSVSTSSHIHTPKFEGAAQGTVQPFSLEAVRIGRKLGLLQGDSLFAGYAGFGVQKLE